MSLSDLASLGSFVSGLAVLASLIYLTLQIRQAERYQRAIVQQGRAARLSDSQHSLANSANADVFQRGLNGDDDLTLTQLRQYQHLFNAAVVNGEDTFLQHEAGLISDDVFEGFSTLMRTVCAQVGWRVMWRRTRSTRGNGYRKFLDHMVAETPVAAPADELANWRADVATERAGVPR